MATHSTLIFGVICVLFFLGGTNAMVHPDEQGNTVNISAPDSSCLIAQLPEKIGEVVPNSPAVEYVGCYSASKLNLTQYIDDPYSWKGLSDSKPSVNVTAACAAHCVKNNTYKHFQMAIVASQYCYCLEEDDRVKSGSLAFDTGHCQPWISNSTLQLRVYSMKLQCPLNLTMCEKVKGCELVSAPDGFEEAGQCCMYNGDDDDNKFRYSLYGGMIRYVIAIIFILACVEAVIYGCMRRRAAQRGELTPVVDRDPQEADVLSAALLASFETVDPPGATAGANNRTRNPLADDSTTAVEMTERRPTAEPLSLVNLDSMNHCVVHPRPATPPLPNAASAGGGAVIDGVVEDADHCSICLDEMHSKPAVKLPCSHKMHSDCLKDFMSHELRKKDKITCPMCRAQIGSANDVDLPALSVPSAQSSD